MQRLHWLLKFLVITLLAGSLSGCLSTAYTGVTTLYNSYNVEKDLNNKWVDLKAINVLNADKTITQNASISVDTVNFVVLLTGHVDNANIRDKAVALVRKIRGVKRVVDAIVIGSGTSTGNDIKDDWITTKLKAKYMLNDGIDASAIKVVTTGNGIVFLMGVVPAPMAKLAAKLAQHTSGVKKVIRLLEIITVKI